MKDERRCRFVWTVDVLPNSIAPYIDPQMDLAVAAMKTKLDHRS